MKIRLTLALATFLCMGSVHAAGPQASATPFSRFDSSAPLIQLARDDSRHKVRDRRHDSRPRYDRREERRP